MSKAKGTDNLDAATRENFRDFFWNTLLPDLDRQEIPEKKRYDLQRLQRDNARVTVHNQALNDSPLNAGDEITQYYVRELGMVIIDLNPDK